MSETAGIARGDRVPMAWEVPPVAWRLVALLAGAKLAVHLAAAWRYGYFRDELYFLDLGRNLAWGYVDCAPLVALYARLALLLGGSLPVVRLIPALAGAALVALTMLLAREMGGRRYAQVFAGLCVVAAPIRLAVDGLLSMNAFEPLFWMGCVWAVIRIARGGDSRLWLLVGVLAGLGLQNKHSTAFFVIALAVGLVASPLRRELARPWPWLGGAVAVLLFLPNVVWQAAHGFPTLETLENVRRTGKNVVLSPGGFLAQQVLLQHPLLLPVWAGGLVSLLAGHGRRLRVLGVTFLAFFALMFAMGAKHYYLAPIYPMLCAAGAAALERLLQRRTALTARRRLQGASIGLVVLLAASMAPAILPLLPPERLLTYQRALGMAPARTEVHHEGPLDQRLGDQFGWPELVAEVARIYHALPADERARTGIFAANYGQAGALNQFGPSHGLPPPICAHQNHFLWGPPDFEGDTLIWLQWGPDAIGRWCESVEQAGAHFHPWGMAEENRPIYLCRGLRTPLAEAWPRLKHWN